MKTTLSLVFALVLGTSAVCAQDSTAVIPLHSRVDTISYIIGMNFGNDLQRQSIPINAKVLYQSLLAALAGNKSIIPEDSAMTIMIGFQQEIKDRKENAQKQIGDNNMKAGKDFLEANKQQPGVKVTASGLQFKVITEGKGKHPAATDTVKVHYRGTLIDGKEFDSSYKRGEPIEFPLNRVIKGWTEGVQLMTVGAKYMFFIPSELAYGERGAGDVIGPNATLIFEVELLGIK